MFASPNTSHLIVIFNPLILNNKAKPMSRFSCRATGTNAKTMTTTTTTMTDYYKLLSLSHRSNASADEIKSAYRALALRYHPDVCDPSLKEQSTKMFVQMTAAYKTLSDPALRREYDSALFGVNRNSIWQQQIIELKRRSAIRMEQRDGKGSWGTKMRAAHNHWN